VHRLKSRRTTHLEDIVLPLHRRVGEMDMVIVEVHSLSVVKTLSGGSAQDLDGVQASEISDSQKVLCLAYSSPQKSGYACKPCLHCHSYRWTGTR
jgi:hypothetical protein